MTKTKKQLRAEAVERLVKLGEVGFYYEIIDALCDADCEDWSGDKVASTIRDLLTDDDSTISEDDSTAERGMTNLEWLYEHDEYFNSFAKLMACLRGFSTDAFTANEWLRQEYSNDDSTPEKVVSGSEPCVTPESCRQYADQRKQGDDADCESCDTREKLENDVWSGCDHLTMLERGPVLVNVPWDRLLGWLDRQAAITQHEITERWAEHLHPIERECGDLRRKVAELTAERDELKGQVFTLKGECEDLENELYKTKAERDELKELNEYHALQYELASEDADRLQAQVDGLQSKLAEYEDRSMQYVMLTGGKFYTGTKALTERIAELTAELDAAKQQISQFDAPKSVETSENPASKCEISDFDDSRDKLEADVREWIDIATYKTFTPERMLEVMLHWLDRQAAITERETTKRHEIFCETCEAESDKQIAELTAERDNLEANNQQLHTLAGEQAATIDELQAQADEKWNLYVAEHRRADINAADREMYREATSALVDSITDGLRKVDAILDGKDEGLA